MKSNLVKYIFFGFIIVILIFAVYKIDYKDNGKSHINETEDTSIKKEEIKTNIQLAIASYDTINPILSNNQDVQNISKLIFEPLVTLTNNYKADPCLAIQWAKIDNNAYLIKLRENVKWSNGEKFTGHDVRFTIDKLKEINSIYSYNVQNVIGVEVVDDYTVKISLDRNVPFFEYNLTFPIMCKSYYEGKEFLDGEINKKPVGTGMFKINDNQGSNIILSKNQSWWNIENKDAILETITVNTNSSKAEVYNAFKMGNIDLVSTSNVDFRNYIGTIGYTLKEYPGREHEFLCLNTNNQILADAQVRQAIYYSLDTQNIISNAFGGNYYIADFPLGYGSWLDSSENAGHIYNTEYANQLLEEAGWIYKNNSWRKTENYKTQKLVLNLLVKKSDTNRVKVAQIIKTQLEQMGINVNINEANDGVYNANVENRNYDLLLAGTTVSASPDLTTYFGENNLANYANEEVISILNELNSITDEGVLREKYTRLKQIYKIDVPYISLYFNKEVVAYNPELAGEVASNWYNLFYNIEKWYK